MAAQPAVPPDPIAGADAAATATLVFTVGDRLRRDTEGLV